MRVVYKNKRELVATEDLVIGQVYYLEDEDPDDLDMRVEDGPEENQVQMVSLKSGNLWNPSVKEAVWKPLTVKLVVIE